MGHLMSEQRDGADLLNARAVAALPEESKWLQAGESDGYRELESNRA